MARAKIKVERADRSKKGPQKRYAPVRVRPEEHQIIAELAERQGRPLSRVITDAIRVYVAAGGPIVPGKEWDVR